MPFELSQAQPVKKPSAGFDLRSAKPSRSPKAQATETRAQFQKDQHDATMQADREENESSLGGIVHGTIEGISELDPIGATANYVKDYGKGIATALEDDSPVSQGDMLLGLGGSTLAYPASMAAGAVMAPFTSGDYRTEQQKAFNAMNDLLPAGAKAAQEKFGAVLKPVGDLVNTVGSGNEQLLTAAGVPEQYAKNIVNPLIDAAEFATVKRAAPKMPVVNPGPKPRAPVTSGPTADPIARARDAGYQVPGSARTPENKPASRVGSVVEAAAGRGPMARRHNLKDDTRVEEGIRKDLGLPANTPLTNTAFNAIMDDAGKIYDGVKAALPKLKWTDKLQKAVDAVGEARRNNPLLNEAPDVSQLRAQVGNVVEADTGAVLKAAQDYRDTARLLREGISKAEKPEIQTQKAAAFREMAKVLEQALDESLQASGRPDLIPSLNNARTRMAKTHQAREAVSGKKRPGVALMDMKQAGEFLSGEMELAADVFRDKLPPGKLSVDAARVDANPGGVIQALQTGARSALGPVLTSEFGQRFMHGPRRPETLKPYDPKMFDVPGVQGNLGMATALELDPPPGNLGPRPMPPPIDFTLTGGLPPGAAFRNPNRPGAPEFARDMSGDASMPPAGAQVGDLVASETPRIQGDIDFIASAPDTGLAAGLELAPEQGVFPGVEVPPAAATTEFLTDQPINRRRNPERTPYVGDDRRINGVPDRSAERQAVLDRPIGTQANAGLPNELLADPRMQAAVRGDTTRGRLELYPEDRMPAPLSDREMLDLQLAPADLEMQRGGIGQEIGRGRIDPEDGAVYISVEDLEALGYSPEEIAQLLGGG